MQEIIITAASKKEIKDEEFTLSCTVPENEGLLLYVTEGKFTVDFNGKPAKLCNDTFILCDGGDSLTCSFSKKNKVAFFLMRFTYSGGKSISNTYGLKDTVYHCNTPDVIRSAFENFIREFIIRTPRYRESVGILFHEVLHKLSLSKENSNPVTDAVYSLAEEIHENFIQGEIDISSYAEKVNLSKDRFSVIFKEYFGYPPHKYQLLLKMNEALTLLRHTDLPISKISDLLGFSSQLYFSSAFKKHMGMTPTKARKALPSSTPHIN